MAEASSYDQQQLQGDINTTFAPRPLPMSFAPSPPARSSTALSTSIAETSGLFTGISAVSGAAVTVTSALQLFILHAHPMAGKAAVASPALIGIVGLVAMVVYFVFYSVSHAATVSAVTSLYLGDPTSYQQAFRSVLPRWGRYVGIALWQIWSGVWIFFFAIIIPIAARTVFLKGAVAGAVLAGVFAFVALTLGVVYGVIAYIRNSLAVSVEVMEDLSVRDAMPAARTSPVAPRVASFSSACSSRRSTWSLAPSRCRSAS